MKPLIHLANKADCETQCQHSAAHSVANEKQRKQTWWCSPNRKSKTQQSEDSDSLEKGFLHLNEIYMVFCNVTYHLPLMDGARWGKCLFLTTQRPREFSTRGRRQAPQCELPGWQKCLPARAQSKLRGHKWDPVGKETTWGDSNKNTQISIVVFFIFHHTLQKQIFCCVRATKICELWIKNTKRHAMFVTHFCPKGPIFTFSFWCQLLGWCKYAFSGSSKYSQVTGCVLSVHVSHHSKEILRQVWVVARRTSFLGTVSSITISNQAIIKKTPKNNKRQTKKTTTSGSHYKSEHHRSYSWTTVQQKQSSLLQTELNTACLKVRHKSWALFWGISRTMPTFKMAL